MGKSDERDDAERVEDGIVLLLTSLQGEGISDETVIQGALAALQSWMDCLPEEQAASLSKTFSRTVHPPNGQADMDVPMMVKAAEVRLALRKDQS
jgi:hypothetical protein